MQHVTAGRFRDGHLRDTSLSKFQAVYPKQRVRPSSGVGRAAGRAQPELADLRAQTTVSTPRSVASHSAGGTAR
jgi:hypothetical protein